MALTRLDRKAILYPFDLIGNAESEQGKEGLRAETFIAAGQPENRQGNEESDLPGQEMQSTRGDGGGLGKTGGD